MDFRKTKEYIPNKKENVNVMASDPNHEYMFYDIKNDLNKITQAKLSEILGVHMSLIGALESENNSHGLSIYNLYQISKILNVRVDKFFEEWVLWE